MPFDAAFSRASDIAILLTLIPVQTLKCKEEQMQNMPDPQ
jgi:hypothetical protein